VKFIEFIFWISIGVLFYTYFFYPPILFIISKLLYNRKKSDRFNFPLPRVNLLIAAYNEEKVIKDKLENCLNIDYPEELFEIWVASDGSIDRTNCIVREFISKYKRFHLLEFPRSGKSNVINMAMMHISDGIIVFSDANTILDRSSIKNIVKKFDDKEVGCVSGKLVYRNPKKVISGEGENFYWRYENLLKKIESNIGFVSGANGAIYAIKKSLFEPLSSKTINDDFTISMKIVAKGFKCIYAEDALAYEEVAPDIQSEFKRHVRDGGGHYIAISQLTELLNPMVGIRSFIYWSHRILRWAAPFLLMQVLITNFFLIESKYYLYLFYSQILFYLFALMGFILSGKSKRIPLVAYIPFYFCNLNIALLWGFMKVITGFQKSTWESTMRNSDS
jgi:cellulose synthase/poly-beta-1,6-N-acetylglucosamine synthase-like glycosyltransferase